MSVKNNDKTPQMVEAAQILSDAGFTIVATRGTAGFLKAAGIEAETVNKVYEGRPNVVDRLRDGDINLVFNTTEGAASIEDSREIRSVALYSKIVYYTTAAASYAAALAIRNIRESAIEVAPLQEY
jgi:carbamoyl-phosphate synthase large subunit